MTNSPMDKQPNLKPKVSGNRNKSSAWNRFIFMLILSHCGLLAIGFDLGKNFMSSYLGLLGLLLFSVGVVWAKYYFREWRRAESFLYGCMEQSQPVIKSVIIGLAAFVFWLSWPGADTAFYFLYFFETQISALIFILIAFILLIVLIYIKKDALGEIRFRRARFILSALMPTSLLFSLILIEVSLTPLNVINFLTVFDTLFGILIAVYAILLTEKSIY